MHRAQLIPIRPTVRQRQYLARAAGTARFAYNWALGEWKRQAKLWWDSGKVAPYPSAFALQKQFNAIKRERFPWTAETSAEGVEKAIFSVGRAFEAFRSGDTRYPTSKGRGSKRAFVAASRVPEIRIDRNRISLPRISGLRLVAPLRWPEETPRSAVISERGGRWFVALVYEMQDHVPQARPTEAAGVDLGIKTPLVVTAGTAVVHFGGDTSERLNVERRKLRRANKRLHRRVHGSGRRDRARQLVARIHYRMANIRSDMQHKATRQISQMASRIGVETLAVRNMMRNGRLARSIADVGFFEVKRQLKYKADEVIEADRFYPSSKTCSACGGIKQDLKLSDRVFRCEYCGHECDRDENAARNLEKLAADCAVSARGARSPARRRKLTLSSLASKREVQVEARNR